MKRTILLSLALAVVFGGAGYYLGTAGSNEANAQEACVVDRPLLARLYKNIFHRPLDSGADFHLNKPLATVLNDVENSPEQNVYRALFLSLKAYEEAIRVNGDNLSAEDKAKYLDLINSALSNVIAWAETLPQQSSDARVVGPLRARMAIMKAYESMNATAKSAAEYGLFNALDRLGVPDDIVIPEDDPDEVVEDL